MNWLKTIRELLCRHEPESDRFNESGMMVFCAKCGKKLGNRFKPEEITYYEANKESEVSLRDSGVILDGEV